MRKENKIKAFFLSVIGKTEGKPFSLSNSREMFIKRYNFHLLNCAMCKIRPSYLKNNLIYKK